MPTVAVGQKITSREYRLAARGANDKLRSGLGDICESIHYLWLNLVRLVRNPDSSGFVFPPLTEWHEIYGLIDPDHSQLEWPVAGPGDYEGANLANPMMQFIFGLDPTLDSEDIRLARLVLWPWNRPPQTDEERWWAGKYQRGAFDPTTGAQSAPALEVAEDFFRIAAPTYSPHLKTYGGMFPMPVILATDCGVDAETGLGVPSWEIMFTALDKTTPTTGLHGTIGADADGYPTVTYSGTCPCWTTGHAANHVLGISRLPFAYYVAVGLGGGCDDYAWDRFDTSQWIEGPYTGPAQLAHDDGQQLQRAITAFASDFRGTAVQREGEFDIRSIAWPFQEMMTRQYALAPAYAKTNGDYLDVVYPAARWEGNQSSGTAAPFYHGGTRYPEGWVCAGVFAKAEKLKERAQVSFWNNEQLMATVTLEPDADGYASKIVWLQTAVRPEPLAMTLPIGARFTEAGGYIEAEATMIEERKPNVWDAYLCCRLSAMGRGSSVIDGRGRDFYYSAEAGKDFLAKGSIHNPTTDVAEPITEAANFNPVLEGVRRLILDHIRMVQRRQFLAYEVAGGKSILYFKRFSYGLANNRVDCFAGIAPPIDALSEEGLEIGETYEVYSAAGTGYVTHRGRRIQNGGTFEAVTAEFSAVGDAQVFIHDGIRATARKQGFTNEWLMHITTACYNDSEASVWKPSAYADFFGPIDRCHFYSGTAPSVLRRHMCYNADIELDPVTNAPIRNPDRVQAQWVAPEGRTGHRYLMGANQLYVTDDFCSSCQIYEKPFEVESCVVSARSGSYQEVKLTFKERFRAHPDAPATVSKNPPTWDSSGAEPAYVTALRAEDYRTPDNALREYAQHQVSPQYQCSLKVGDRGTGSSIPEGVIRGSCIPKFWFTALVKEPFEDSNDIAQSQDSKIYADEYVKLESYIRAGCEGFVDGYTSEQIICNAPAGVLSEHVLYDFTFKNLCFQAFGGRDIGAMKLDVRPDRPAGHGPLPNTTMYAEVHNRIAECLNLMDRVRLELPLTFRFRQIDYEANRTVKTVPFGNTECWSDANSMPGNFVYGGITTWNDFPVVAANINSYLQAPVGPAADDYNLRSLRIDTEYRVEVNASYANAIRSEIQELIDASQSGFLAKLDTEVYTERRNQNNSTTFLCNGSYDFVDGSGNLMEWLENTHTLYSQCVLINSGLLVADTIPTMDYYYGDPGAPDPCNNTGTSYKDLALKAAQSAFIRVPLVDAV